MKGVVGRGVGRKPPRGHYKTSLLAVDAEILCRVGMRVIVHIPVTLGTDATATTV